MDRNLSKVGGEYVEIVSMILRDDEVICENCKSPRFTWEKCVNCGYYPNSVGQNGAPHDATVRVPSSE